MGAAWTLNLEGVLPAGVDRVWEVLTEPAEIRRWWGPHGFDTPGIEMDLRPGGHFRFTMQPPEGDVFHAAGEFLEIVPGERLAYTFRWEEPDPDDVETTVVLTLRRVDDGHTHLTLQQGDFTTEARLQLHHGGWSDGFERLDAAARGPG